MSEEVMNQLNDRLRLLEHDNAERKPVAELIKIFMYFLIGISVVLGLFGLKQFSDIRNIIQEEVSRQYPKDQQKFLEYQSLIDKTELLSKNFQELHGKYSVALSNFANLDKVTADFDIEGKIGQIITESTQRYRSDQEGGKSVEIYEEPWRSNAISLLELLASTQMQRDFDSDFIFNAAQSADQLKMNDLAFRLMSEANKKRPNDAPIRAGMLSGAVDIGNEGEVDKAFLELLDMVRNLSPHSPNIVLSEAWNSTEDQRRYPELIKAINDLINSQSNVPSYAHAIQAEAYLRSSQSDALIHARKANQRAKETLANETAHSVWADSSMRQIAKVDRIIAKSEALREVLVNDLAELP